VTTPSPCPIPAPGGRPIDDPGSTGTLAVEHRSWRTRLLLAVVLAMLATPLTALGTPPAAHATTDPAKKEAEFVASINVERAKHDLPALTVRDDLRAVAGSHSRRMASASRLHHNPDFSREITDWQVVAENVGRGPTVGSLHRAFMDSDGHRANILNDRVTEVGVGVEVRDGQIWVTQNFRRPTRSATVSPSSTTLFGDVASTNVHHRGILAAVERGFIEGCGVARFCPDDAVSRGDFVVMLGTAMDLSPASTSRFDDVSGTVAGYAEALARLGVVNGTTVTTFSPHHDLTRAQFAALFARALDLEPVASPFRDVPAIHDGTIGALADRGILRGCAEGRFCPADGVTRAQAATLLTNEFGH